MQVTPYSIFSTLGNNTIKFLKENRIKEDDRLGFIQNICLDINNERRKNELSILISSFANTCGGIVIAGCNSKKGVVSGYDYFNEKLAIDLLGFFLESNIYPGIHKIEIEEFRGHEDIGYFYRIHIPNSSDIPHMALDRKYYKRKNGKAVVMEEYEIREMYTRSKKAELDFFAITNSNGVPVLENGRFNRVSFYPRFLIKNIGSSVEDFYKIELYIPSGIYNPNFSALQKHFSRLEDQYTVFSRSSDSPLFQHEIATVFEANLVIDGNNFHLLEKNEIIMRIYGSNGIKVKHIRAIDTFTYNNEKLRLEDFSNVNDILEITTI